jgi:hypothetical protein
MQVHGITCADIEKGISLNTGELERDGEPTINFYDSHLYGETKALDCPQGSAEDCVCVKKFAWMTGSFMNDSKDMMPTMSSALPIYKSHGEGNWGGVINIENVRFSKFLGRSACGERSVIFERNPDGSDKIPPHFLKNCKFEDVNDDGFAFL